MTTAFDGKVALVTGAGGGIGLATAQAFAKAGASVVLADRDGERVGRAAEDLRAAGHNAIGVTCDVTDSAQVEAMIERAVSTYGRLDAAFNNAGVNSEAAAFVETGDAEFERMMNVNLRGVWNCMKGELRRMMAQGSGAIVNCSSIGGVKGSKGRSAYSASKHAVIGLTRSAARLCRQGHPHQRGLPGNGQHADGRPRHQELRFRNREADGGARTHRTLRSAGRDRRCRGMALQPGRELHGGSCHGGRWRLPSRLIPRRAVDHRLHSARLSQGNLAKETLNETL